MIKIELDLNNRFSIIISWLPSKIIDSYRILSSIDLEMTVSQVEYGYEVSNVQRTDQKGICLWTYSFKYTHAMFSVLCYVNVEKQQNKTTFLFNCCGRIRQSIKNIKYRANRCLSLFFCSKLVSLQEWEPCGGLL